MQVLYVKSSAASKYVPTYRVALVEIMTIGRRKRSESLDMQIAGLLAVQSPKERMVGTPRRYLHLTSGILLCVPHVDKLELGLLEGKD